MTKSKWHEFYVNMDNGYSLCSRLAASHKVRTTPNTYSVYLIEDGRRQLPEKAARKVIAQVLHHMYHRYTPCVCG